MEILRIENLSFSYPKQERKALSDVSMSVNTGEITLICGASGCGKSTLLRHMKTVLTPYGEREGGVYFKGAPLHTYTEREQAKSLGFVLQHPDDQIVTDKVWHELAFGPESLGESQEKMRLRIGEMASYFGIQGWFYRSVTELSGGQKQLLNLASVMVMDPDILILDEPTSQLDPIAAAEFLSTLKKLNSELGITIILTEHRLEEAFPMADMVYVMDKGTIAMHGSPREVASHLPADDILYPALPSACKIHRVLSEKDECALTVKEARTELEAHGFRERLLNEYDVRPHGDAVLELSEISFRYSRDADDVLRGLDMTAYAGEIFSIVGGNGTGKSTMLSVIAGVNRPYRGKIRILGRECKRVDAQAQRIAALPQDPRTLFVKNTVLGDLEEMLTSVRDREEKSRLIDEAAEKLHIKELLLSHPYDLSGGEQQRAAIAKVLLTKPEILLLDEPTKGMDAHFKSEFGEMLRKLGDICIIIVSHDIEFCAEFSDRCGLFFDGCIITDGTPRKFFCENNFYTTAASRIARGTFPDAVLTKEVENLCMDQLHAR